MEPRLIVAFALIGAITLSMIGGLVAWLPRRQREKLRRRGIKRLEQ